MTTPSVLPIATIQSRSIKRQVRSAQRWLDRLRRVRPWSLIKRKKRVGSCPACLSRTLFVHVGDWSREDYRCIRCGCSARGRALLYVLKQTVHGLNTKQILELAPYGPVSRIIECQCRDYTGTVYEPTRPFGEIVGDFRNEDVRSLSFGDETFNVVVTQDVFEHVFNPDRAFAEIARVLKPNGYHIFTVPLHKGQRTLVRAKMEDDSVLHAEEAVYHAAPYGETKALVVTDWGDDIVQFIKTHSGMDTTVMRPRMSRLGIEGNSLEVLISHKNAG